MTSLPRVKEKAPSQEEDSTEKTTMQDTQNDTHSMPATQGSKVEFLCTFFFFSSAHIASKTNSFMPSCNPHRMQAKKGHFPKKGTTFAREMLTKKSPICKLFA
jgi:hypothetical protein